MFFNNVLKTGPDRSVRHIGPLTDLKTGPIQFEKPFFDRIGQEHDEPVSSLPTFFFFKLERRCFNVFYIENDIVLLRIRKFVGLEGL